MSGSKAEADYARKINADPITTNAAPTHANAAGRSFVVIHKSGSSNAGVVEDSVDTIPISPPVRTYRTSVIPTAIPIKPDKNFGSSPLC